MEFIETRVFTERVEKFVSGTHGARKGRVADPSSGRGKSSGYRYLYIYLKAHGRIYLLFIFAKNEQSNLTDQQKKTIAELVRQIEDEVQKRDTRAIPKKKVVRGR